MLRSESDAREAGVVAAAERSMASDRAGGWQTAGKSRPAGVPVSPHFFPGQATANSRFRCHGNSPASPWSGAAFAGQAAAAGGNIKKIPG
jgi:hypothetical protein